MTEIIGAIGDRAESTFGATLALASLLTNSDDNSSMADLRHESLGLPTRQAQAPAAPGWGCAVQ